jgi:hypothetical protein
MYYVYVYVYVYVYISIYIQDHGCSTVVVVVAFFSSLAVPGIIPGPWALVAGCCVATSSVPCAFESGSARPIAALRLGAIWATAKTAQLGWDFTMG